MVTTRRSSAAKSDQDNLALTSTPVLEDDLRLGAKRPREKPASQLPVPSKKRRSLRSSGPAEDLDRADHGIQSASFADANTSIDNTAGVDSSVPVQELQEDFIASKSDNNSRPRQTPARDLVRSTEKFHVEGGPVKGDGGVGKGKSRQEVAIEAQNALQDDGEVSSQSRFISAINGSIANAHKRFPSEESATQLTLSNVQPQPEAATVPSLLLGQHAGEDENSDNDAPEAIYSKGMSSSDVTPVSVPRKRKRKSKSKVVTNPSDSPELVHRVEVGNNADQLAVPEVKTPEDFPLQKLPQKELEAIMSTALSTEEGQEQTNKRSLSIRVGGPSSVQNQPTSGPLGAGSTRRLLKSSINKPLKHIIKDSVVYRPQPKTKSDLRTSRHKWQGSQLPPKSNPSNWRLKKQVMGRKKVQRVWCGRVNFLRT